MISLFKWKKKERIWIDQYKEARANLEYPKGSMFDALMEVAKKYPEYYAYEYFGKKVTYRTFIKQIEMVAKALKNYGVDKNDRITICMPSTPEAICTIYATNLIGAVANMIHPLSSEKEIENFVNQADSKYIVILDVTLEKVMNIKKNTKIQKVIVAKPDTSMPPLTHYLYKITNYKKRIKLPKNDDDIVPWNHFISSALDFVGICYEKREANDLAAILYSGGTTGTPKGIMLTNLNFNALALGAHELISETVPGNTVLSLLPIFHGFGLAVCIHTPLLCAMKCILIPQFNAKKFGDLIKKTKPNFLVGVPTLFEALLKQKLKKDDLECVEAVISGGDTLTKEQKNRIDEYLKEHGSRATIRPGYGLTEATASTCLTIKGKYVDNCIGIPFPDTYFKIVKIGTNKEVSTGEEGEICINGPTVMKGYLNNKKETQETLIKHDDGKVWLHTGDVGRMLKDGTILFEQRIKRIIVSSGYNIYPSYIENVILKHKDVESCAVIGIPHQYKGEVAKAYIVLKKGVDLNNRIKKEIQELCHKNISKFSLPKEFEYCEDLPKTKVGKIDIIELKKRSMKK